MDETLIKRIISSIKCGSCGQNYHEDHIEIVEHNDELWFLKVFCSSCHIRCLVAAIIRENAQPEVITDLTEAEVAKFKNLEGVKGRLEIVGEARGGLAAVDYAHKPEALAAMLAALRPFVTGKLICVS